MISAQFFVSTVVILVVIHAMLGSTAYLIFLERKVCAWTQDRIGPNRVGFGMLAAMDGPLEKLGLGFLYKKFFGGFGQALADGIKLFLKEDYTPPYVDKILFFLGPALAVIPALIGWAVIPWGGTWDFAGIAMPGFLAFLSESDWLVRPSSVDGVKAVVAVAPINIGVIYILAVGSVAVYGISLGAYGSNNKFSFLGGLRATAQMLSYEIPMGLCVLIMIMMFKTTDAGVLANTQASSEGFGAWGIFAHPFLAVIFFICLLAESNRAPFDLAEAEQELVGGFHTEYSSMKWALFFLGEYMHMITGCAFFCILFLGGWDMIPFVNDLPIVAESGLSGLMVVMTKFGVLCGKIFFLLFVMMWIRWTLPRLRFDQLMKLAWRGMIPLMIFAMLLNSVLIYLDVTQWYIFAVSDIALAVGAAVVAPMLPKGPPVNRKLPMAGSRFSPLVETSSATN